MRDVLIKISAKQSEDGEEHHLVTWQESEKDPLTAKLPAARIKNRFENWNGNQQWREDPFRKESGDCLFKLLDHFRDPAGSSLLKALLLGPVSTLTFQIEDPELQTFPWELICIQNISLVARHHLKFRSGEPPLPPGNAVPEDWPLRILVIKATPDSDEADTGSELDGIRQTGLRLGPKVNLQVLEQPNAEEITSSLKAFRPHIFHFSGHGKFDDGNSFLTLIDRKGKMHKWPMSVVNMTFGAHSPRCVILNACETAATAANSQGSEVWSAAQSLLNYGCQFVIAMQGAIRSSEATIFGHEFFRHLATQLEDRSHTPDFTAAFHAARHQLSGSPDSKDWCLPRLLENASVKKPHFKKIQQSDFFDNHLFQSILPFLDRYCYRGQFGPMNDFFSQECEHGGLILHAKKRSGLTYLTRFIIATAELNGCLVDYQSYNQLTSLRQPFESFINEILEEDFEESDDYESDDHGESLLTLMFRFLNQKAAERNRPIVIAFDQIKKSSSPSALDLELTNLLMTSSFAKNHPNLRIILAMEREAFESFIEERKIPKKRWQIHKIDQKPIPNIHQHYREYIRFFCERNGKTPQEVGETTKDVMNLATTKRPFIDPETPAVFERLFKIIEAIS